MRSKLAVAVSPHTDVSVRTILESLGVLHDEISDHILLSPDDAVCMVTTMKEDCTQFIESGGVLLAPSDCWPIGVMRVSTWVTPYSRDDLGWLSPVGDRQKTSEPVVMSFGQLGHGYCVELPRFFIECWENHDIGKKHICLAAGSPNTVTEYTSAYNKSAIQKLMLLALQKCHQLRAVPLLTKSRFPTGASNVFCYRLDCDGGSPEDVGRTVKALAIDAPRQAYFFNVYHYRHMPEIVSLIRAQGCSVENHSFVHFVFDDEELELLNIRMGHDWLLKHTKQEPRGFACPGIGYNPALLLELETMGYRHYHSFGNDYDLLPHRIVVDGRVSRLWNLSYHPISLGRLIRSVGRYEAELVKKYYENLADVRQQRSEPHFYYCHPEGRIGQHPEIYEWIRAAVLKYSDVQKIDLMSYVAFLDRRVNLKPSVYFDRDSGKVLVERVDDWRQAGIDIVYCGARFRSLGVQELIDNPLDLNEPLEMVVSVGDTVSIGLTTSRREAASTIDELRNAMPNFARALQLPDLHVLPSPKFDAAGG